MSEDNTSFHDQLLKDAENGDLEAMCNLGKMYMTGLPPVRRDLKKAAVWLQKAADMGHTESEYCLGMLYSRGGGVRHSHTKALEYYLKAAEKGHYIAMGFAATYYLTGPGIEQDIEKGLYWMEKSAEGGDKFSMMQLSEIYSEKNTNPVLKAIKKDNKKSEYWLNRASQSGYREAQEMTGISKVIQPKNPEDVQEGLKLLEKAAEQHSILAESLIGFCYEMGAGVEVDYEKALEWYMRAVKENPALHPGVDTNRIKLTAVNPKEKTRTVTYIEHENASFAWYRLGVFYEDGLFVIQNKEAALDCYRRACTLGETNSCKKVKELEKELQ